MPDRVISKNEVRGTASGVFFMALFGTAWAGIGIGGLQGWVSSWLILLVLSIGIGLFLCFIVLTWRSRNLAKSASKADARTAKRIGTGFGITFGAEGICIAAASIICNAVDHFELFFPVMALIVGVHFFPLAYLFQVRVHYIAGGLLCLLAVVTLLFIPEHVQIGQHQIIAWWTFLGFGSALILWITGLVIWLMGHRLLKAALGGK
jgi:putative effector of murein hydrolase LrgA (UPF0299 family)